MDILQEKIVKTRKSHQCFACLRIFEAGTKMKTQTNINDGDIGTVYSCKTCETLLGQHKDAFFDEYEQVYPEACVCELYHDYSVKNPEDLLIAMQIENNKSKI